MTTKLTVTIEIIAHATEDIKKILKPFADYEIKYEEFSIQNLTGHFENPISRIWAKIKKEKAKSFVKKFISKMPDEEMKILIETLESRIQNSTLYLRLLKQKFIEGKLTLGEKDSIRISISTPIYQKQKSTKTYLELLNYQDTSKK